MRWLALSLALAACTVDIAPYEGRGCNAESPCLAASGRVCVRGRCELPWDGGFYPLPDATTTGPWPNAVLKPSGPLEVTEAGKLVEGLDIEGCVKISADGVTLRNLRIRTDGRCTGAPLLDARGAKGTLVEDVEIDGTGHGQVHSVMGAEMTLRRLHLHDVFSGIRLSGDQVQLEHSLIRKVAGTSAGAYVSSGGVGFSVVHNVLEVEEGDCVVTLYSQDSAIRDVRVEANLINGAGYCVYAGGGTPALPTSDLRFVRNRFGRKFHPKCGSYGPVAYFEVGRPGNVWDLNVWDDTEAPVSP